MMQDHCIEALGLAERAAALALTRRGKQINSLFATTQKLVGEQEAQRLFADAFMELALALNARRFKHRVPSPVDRLYKVLCRHVPVALANATFDAAKLQLTRKRHVPVPRPRWNPHPGLAATGASGI